MPNVLESRGSGHVHEWNPWDFWIKIDTYLDLQMLSMWSIDIWATALNPLDI